MAETTGRKNGRLFYEIALSLYFPLLPILANTITSIQHPATNSWIQQHGYFKLITLWAIPALVLLLCVHMLAGLAITEMFLRTIGGVVVVAGYPLIRAYISFRGFLNMLGSVPRAMLYAFAPERWLGIELLATLICVVLYASSKRPTDARAAILLVALHFAIWTWFVGIGNGGLAGFGLGFLASLAWVVYVNPTNFQRRHSSPATVQL